MGELQIHIDGLAEQDLRLRLRRQIAAGLPANPYRRGNSRPALANSALALSLLAGAALYSNSDASRVSIAAAGQEIRAARVLLLKDVSGTMRPWMPALARKARELRALGVQIDREIDVMGFGVSDSGSPQNVLHTLERSLAAFPDADAVYLISDFNAADWHDTVDGGGFRRLQALLAYRNRRIYIATVNVTPRPDWIQFARESGGDWVLSRR